MDRYDDGDRGGVFSGKSKVKMIFRGCGGSFRHEMHLKFAVIVRMIEISKIQIKILGFTQK